MARNESRVVLVGAGVVGSTIVELLSADEFDVVVVDRDPAVLNVLSERYDIQTLQGHGADPEILYRAGAAHANLMLAITNSDEVNLLAANFAKKLGTEKAVARIRSRHYLQTKVINSRRSLGIDLFLSPEALTASEIVNFLDYPGVIAISFFAHGKVQLRQVVVDPMSPYCNVEIRDCNFPQGVLVVSCARNGEVVIPHGDFKLAVGDRISLLGQPKSIEKVQKLFHSEATARKIAISGGHTMGFVLARSLEQENFVIKLIEPNPERCQMLGESLRKTKIVCGHPTDMALLREEHFDASNVFVAATNDDENNLMSCLLAKDLGISKTIMVLNRPEFAHLIKKVGIDLVLSPKNVLANQILDLMKKGLVKSVSLFEDGKVELLEFEIKEESDLVGKPIIELGLPKNILLGAIVRKDKVIVPHGKDVIEIGDTVIAFGLADVMAQFEKKYTSSE